MVMKRMGSEHIKREVGSIFDSVEIDREKLVCYYNEYAKSYDSVFVFMRFVNKKMYDMMYYYFSREGRDLYYMKKMFECVCEGGLNMNFVNIIRMLNFLEEDEEVYMDVSKLIVSNIKMVMLIVDMLVSGTIIKKKLIDIILGYYKLGSINDLIVIHRML
jgi:hypothetical protein